MAQGYVCDYANCESASASNDLKGWVQVQFPMFPGEGFAEGEKWHFCSIKCLSAVLRKMFK